MSSYSFLGVANRTLFVTGFPSMLVRSPAGATRKFFPLMSILNGTGNQEGANPAHPRGFQLQGASRSLLHDCESARALHARVPALRIRPSCRCESLTWTSAYRHCVVVR